MFTPMHTWGVARGIDESWLWYVILVCQVSIYVGMVQRLRVLIAVTWQEHPGICTLIRRFGSFAFSPLKDDRLISFVIPTRIFGAGFLHVSTSKMRQFGTLCAQAQ
jgi:hypothetical protein